jgi:hypothetical protein
MAEYVSLSEALKLLTQFRGNKREVLLFVSSLDTAFEVIKPELQCRFYKFVLTRISDEPSTAIAHQNLGSWAEVKECLRNTYIEKRTFDLHATQLFKAKQEKLESVSEWLLTLEKWHRWTATRTEGKEFLHYLIN